MEEVQKYPGVSIILVAQDAVLQNCYGDHMSKLARALVEKNGYDKVVSAASGFGKDVMPRLGGLLDAQAITDIIEIVDDGQKFKRPVYAGNAVATVSTRDKIKLLTVRATNFEKFEQHVGKEITDFLLKQVRIGEIEKNDAQDIATKLHEEVGGKFKISKGEVNFVFEERSLKKILSDWYSKEAYKLTRQEAVKRLAKAVRVTRKHRDIADELENYL